MTANRAHSIAAADWMRLRQYTAPSPRAAGALWLHLREMAERLRGRRPRRPGGPGEPPEGPRREAHWDDPALWMLMMH